MHDALSRSVAYVLEPDAPSRPRVSTEDLTVQVYFNGANHRRTPDLSHTACGRPFNGERCPVRREELAGDLCTDGCFTSFELRIAADHNRKEFEP